MSSKSESYLVIGGGGFLGQRITEMLLSKGGDVSVFDLRKTFSDDRLANYYLGDVTKIETLVEACQGKTVVIHTASPIHGLPASVYFKVNVDGTKNVIEACKTTGVQKLVFTSSASVVYDGSDLVNGTESIPYCKVHMDAYNETKV